MPRRSQPLLKLKGRISASTDDDGDGLPNGYELQYPGCLSITNAADAIADCDSDWLTNIEEFQRGTNPTTRIRTGMEPVMARKSIAWMVVIGCSNEPVTRGYR
jgi:hypothetical protein